MSGSVFVTHHRGLSAFLLYTTDALLDCFVDQPQDGRKKLRIIYTFSDDGTCANLARDFFAGAGVADARALLECARTINHRTTDTFRKHREEIEQTEGQ